MHVNPRSGKTIITEQDVGVVERFAHLSRAMAFQFGPGSSVPDELLSKAAEDANKAGVHLVTLAKAHMEAEKNGKRKPRTVRRRRRQYRN